jgi:two-component system capsular synthesis sensor histidine kinase RcsC
MVLPDHLRRTFVNSSRDDLQRIARARADQDQPALLDRVHALKGVLMMLGQRGLGERFSVIEAQLCDGISVDAATLDGVIDALQVLVEQQAAQLGAG